MMFSSKWKYLCLPAIIPAIILFISWISPVKTVMPTETIHPVSSGSLENRNWELAEIRFLQENQSYYFKKNDHEASSIELEGDYYRFESNGTGLYQQADGKQFRLNWKYLEQDTAAIRFVIHRFRDNKPLEVTWEKISFRGDALLYLEHYTHANGTQSLGYGERIALPADKACGSAVLGKP